MRDIIRCPSCFTYVYSDARRCHGCGERTGRRRLLTRGSWIFIVLAVTGFAVGRGIDLHQEKRDRVRSELETAAVIDTTTSFLRTWLTGTPEEILEAFPNRRVFGTGLVKQREKYPTVFPASVLTTCKVTSGRIQRHEQIGKGPILHDSSDVEDDRSVRVEESSAPAGRGIGGRVEFTDGKLVRRHRWDLRTFEFEAEVVRGGLPYNVSGKVCIDDGAIFCFQISRIRGAEGDVRPKE